MTETYSAPYPAAAAAIAPTARRVSWGAILAGCVVSLALMILFTTFGIGIGAAAFNPATDGAPGEGFGTTSAIYLVVSQLIALGIGGYIAARLAGIPRTTASVLHGASVWAIATIFMAMAAISGGGAMFGAASTLLDRSARAVGSVGSAIIPDDLSMPDISNLTGQLSVDSLPPELQSVLTERGINEDRLRREATSAFRDVFSQEEQQATVTEAKRTLVDIIETPGDTASDIDAFFDKLVNGPDAILSEEDVNQALTQLEQRLDITPQQAQSIVDSVEAQVKTAIDRTRETIAEARQRAAEAAERASEAVASAAMLLALASVLGLLAACGGAFAGRPSTLVGARIDDRV